MRQIEFILFASIIIISCQHKPEINEVKTDTYFTNLFHRTGRGFTGGDGTYSVELPDGRNIWIFGDTFLGNVQKDGTRKKSDPLYIRNSMVVQDGEKLTTIYQCINGKDHSAVIPPEVSKSDFEISEMECWFWPGDGFIENGELKIFMSEFYQADTGMWGFSWKRTALVNFKLPSISLAGIHYFNYPHSIEIHFGHAVLVDQTYTYIYGLGNSKPYVARAKTGNCDGAWEFFTGNGWSTNSEDCKPMADIEASEQFSVLKREGKYILITQSGSLSNQICSYTSNKPFTGWKNKQVLYKTPLPDANKNIFTYNAVAHPQFINGNTLLISYNTNSSVLEDHFQDAGIYRPRFIWVPYCLIDPDFK